MDLFRRGELRLVLENQMLQFKNELAAQEQNYLLNANEGQLVEYFTQKYRIEPIVLNPEGVYATDTEEMIPAERFDSFRFNVRPGGKYRKQVITYHLPFSGDKELLQYMPSTRILWSQSVPVESGEIRFKGVVFSDGEVDPVKRDWEDFLRSLTTQIGHSTEEVGRFNLELERSVTQAIAERRQDILKKRASLASLGVPIKKSENVPRTFSVPTPKKRVVVSKPVASTAPFVPEPTLDENTYSEILKIIHDTGVEIERHPSIYEGKDEETLRDHLLMVLSPHFNSVTGETFNKSGKTDILIRHDGKNLFVAECGIWKGGKQFLGKIDQLLTYLTWRDSKTAIISFVRNKDFTNVVTAAQSEIKSHPSYVRELPPVEEGWLRYELMLPGDPGRTVKLAVILFHFP